MHVHPSYSLLASYTFVKQMRQRHCKPQLLLQLASLAQLRTGANWQHWYHKVASEWKSKAGVSNKVASERKSKVGVSNKVASLWKSKAGVSNKVASVWKSKAAVSNKVASEWKSKVGVSNKVASEWKSKAGVSNKVASEWKSKAGVSNKVASEWKYKVGVSNKVASVWKSKAGVSNKVPSEWKSKAGVSNEVARERKSKVGVSNKMASERKSKTGVSNKVASERKSKVGVSNKVASKWKSKVGVFNKVAKREDNIQVFVHPSTLRGLLNDASEEMVSKTIHFPMDSYGTPTWKTMGDPPTLSSSESALAQGSHCRSLSKTMVTTVGMGPFIQARCHGQLEHPHTVPADGAVGVVVEGHQVFWTCGNKPFISVLTTVPPHTDSLGVSTKTKSGLTVDDSTPF
ncbi:hypothetical protein NFI96_003232 [Prochilodus magdalenae]|nr:hypothetical protein NFI96_003232 [Prochilodus magdalenae]